MFDENLVTNKYLNPNEYITSFKVDFLRAKPFPSIIIKDFFQEKFLSNVLEEFPYLACYLPEESIVNITIYDLMGNSVKEIVNQVEPSGFKSVQWNGTNNAMNVTVPLANDPTLIGGNIQLQAKVTPGNVFKTCHIFYLLINSV